MRPCARPGCPNIVAAGRCEGCHRERGRQLDDRRESSYARGYNSKWRKARIYFLSARPTCDHCALDGRATAAREVDHIIPHRGDVVLFWDQSNWQPLCSSCHGRKTLLEAGQGHCAHEHVVDVLGTPACVRCGVRSAGAVRGAESNVTGVGGSDLGGFGLGNRGGGRENLSTSMGVGH